MAEQVGSIYYDVALETSKLTSSAKTVEAKLSSLGKSMTSIGKKMTATMTLPIVAGFALAVKGASDLEETINKVDVAFDDQADSVKEWSKTSIKSMGLAQESALDAASLFGDMSTAMGLSTKEANSMSTELVQLGADLASFKNIGFEQAQTALSGVFTGETESLKKLGIIMTEQNLKQYALSEGIQTNISDMTQAEKVQLRYAYVMDQTTNAQGDFIRTSDGTANQIRITQETFKELTAEIGKELLPVANDLLKWVQNTLTWFGKLDEGQQKTILTISGIIAVAGPLIMILGSVAGAIGSLIPIIASVGTAFTGLVGLIGAPIVMPAIAVAAALAAIMSVWSAYTKMKTAFDGLKTAQQNLADINQDILKRNSEVQLSGVYSQEYKDRWAALAKSKLSSSTSSSSSFTSPLSAPQFATGGYTGAGGVNEVAGVVHKGEYVIPKNMVNQSTGTPKASGNNISVNVSMSGVMTSSPADERTIAKRLIERVNEELRSKGIAQIGVA